MNCTGIFDQGQFLHKFMKVVLLLAKHLVFIFEGILLLLCETTMSIPALCIKGGFHLEINSGGKIWGV